MFNQFHTLRFKLTVSYVAIFALFQILLWFIVDIAFTRHLRSRIDQELLWRAQSIVEAFELLVPKEGEGATADRFKEALEPFESDETYVLAFFKNEDKTVRSANVRGVRFPYEDQAPSAELVPRFATLTGEIAQALSGERALRLLTLDVGDESPYYLQVAASLGSLERVITDIQRLLLVFTVVSLVIAGITSWLVAQRSLGVIETVTREASQLSAARLDKRIVVPKSRDEVAHLVETVNDMLDRLENQYKNQQQFISNVGHELKTPLAVLLGEVQLQRKQVTDNPSLIEFMDSVEQEVRHLLRSVESFLILARAGKASRLDVAAEISIENVILTAVQNCTRQAKQRSVHIVPKFNTEEGVSEPIVRGDQDLLTALFENLISNAIRHSPTGQTVEVESLCTVKEVHVSVRDRGPGIPQEHHHRIFEPFYQIPSQSGQEVGKAGIGLAIVRTVVDLHGGAITLRNRDGGGCEFMVRFPLTDGSGPTL